MSTKWQRFNIEIPKGYSPDEREAIAEEIIEFIRERTAKGESWNHEKFQGYSKAYENSLNFKIAGKKKGMTPNLTQSGDTLGALTLLNHQNGKLMIGFERGSQENAIADGNIRGTYGKSKPVGPARDFLGITPNDLKKVLRQYPLSDREESLKRAESASLSRDGARSIMKGEATDEGDDG